MTLLEFGSLAGAMIAVMTLITKIVSLISSIQNLINRLDTMQRDIEFSKTGIQDVTDRIGTAENRLSSLEIAFKKIEEPIKEQVKNVFK